MDILHKKAALDFLSLLEDFFYNHQFDDVDLLNEELKIASAHGVFQFNYHGVSGQIWYSSPVSGAHHFVLIHHEWVSTRTSESIWDRIKKDFNLN
ncbi:MAG: hypothetical protein CNLJKLNK_00599 [Holosporales bacterium]